MWLEYQDVVVFAGEALLTASGQKKRDLGEEFWCSAVSVISEATKI